MVPINAVSGDRAQECQREEQESNHFIPKGMKRADDPWHDMPEELDAMLYDIPLGHNSWYQNRPTPLFPRGPLSIEELNEVTDNDY